MVIFSLLTFYEWVILEYNVYSHPTRTLWYSYFFFQDFGACWCYYALVVKWGYHVYTLSHLGRYWIIMNSIRSWLQRKVCWTQYCRVHLCLRMFWAQGLLKFGSRTNLWPKNPLMRSSTPNTKQNSWFTRDGVSYWCYLDRKDNLTCGFGSWRKGLD